MGRSGDYLKEFFSSGPAHIAIVQKISLLPIFVSFFFGGSEGEIQEDTCAK